MTRLIDADALIDYFREAQDDNKTVMIKIKDLVFMVNNQPTVTERTAEFRKVHLSYDGDDDDTWECSACQQAWIIDGNPKEHRYHYCPNCGARFTEASDGR